MKYLSSAEMARLWNVSERTVRNYCAKGKIHKAILSGKTWNIPEDTPRPERINKRPDLPETLLERLRFEKDQKIKGGIYHRIQVELTYNSNHIEGSRLTEEQTRLIFETNAIQTGASTANVDDIIEASNHFRAIDSVIENARRPLSENYIKSLHGMLKGGTSDSRKAWFSTGAYKKVANIVGGRETTQPKEVPAAMKRLLTEYCSNDKKTLEDLVAFHAEFEKIHPFQDGNGRVGRLILFKECLAYGITPFIIDDGLKFFYYRGLSEWDNERGFLLDTCRAAQDNFKTTLDYFGISYS